jgi:hypothetical protein
MKDLSINILYLVMASFAVIGIIEWIKSLAAAIKAKDGSWKWPVSSFVFSFVVAVFGDGGIFQVLTNFVIILAINEIVGYNMIVKTVFALIDKLTSGVPTVGRAEVVNILNEAKNAAGGVSAEVPPPPSAPAASLSSPAPAAPAGPVPPAPAAPVSEADKGAP